MRRAPEVEAEAREGDVGVAAKHEVQSYRLGDRQIGRVAIAERRRELVEDVGLARGKRAPVAGRTVVGRSAQAVCPLSLGPRGVVGQRDDVASVIGADVLVLVAEQRAQRPVGVDARRDVDRQLVLEEDEVVR